MPQPLIDWEKADLAACRKSLREGSRSFDAAAKLLPRSIRNPAIALYAFCRSADDAIDLSPNRDAHSGLAALRDRVALIYEGQPTDLPPDRAFARVVNRFAIPRALPEALLEGFAWDLEGRSYDDLPELRAYAVRVAGTVGAMMATIMGVRDAPRLAAAVDLGVAMQFSNIARDVGEDALAGRVYLPGRWLDDAGIDREAFLAAPAFTPALGGVVQRLLDVADDHYHRARAGIARLPLTCRFGIAAASLLYQEIGREVGRRGLDSVSGRAFVSTNRKLTLLAAELPRLCLPLAAVSGGISPEGAPLVEAVLNSIPQNRLGKTFCPRLDITGRALWVIDLFARLEQRERVQT